MIHAFNHAFNQFESDVINGIQSERDKLQLNSRDRDIRGKVKVFLDNVSIFAQLLSLFLGK